MEKVLGLSPLTRPTAPARVAAGGGVGDAAPAMAPDTLQPSPTTLDKVTQKAGNLLAENLVYKNYDLKAFDFSPLPYAGLSAGFDLHPISPTDGLITSDLNRAHATQAMQDAGRTVTWAELRGVVRPRLSAGAGVPVGPVDVSVAGWATGELGISVLAPYDRKFEAIQQAGKNLTVDFPFGAEDATKLIEGSEAVMFGRGSVGAGVSVGARPIGASLPMGTSIGVSAGVSNSAYLAEDLSVRIKRLDGSRVHVMISRVDTQGRDHAASLHAGVTTAVSKVASDKASVPDNKATQLVTNAIDKQIERWLQLNAQAVYSTADSERTVAAYTLDLSDPEAAKAYDRLIRLDRSLADELAAQPDGTVKTATLAEKSQTTRTAFEAKAGPINLLKDSTTATKTAGTLETSKGKFDYNLATVDEAHEDLITRWWIGRRDTTREFVETAKANQRAMPGQLYHVRSDVTIDGNTPASTVNRFLKVAGYYVGEDKVNQALATDPELPNRLWRSRLIVDVGIQDQGVKRIVSAPESELMAAYAEAYEELDRPWDNGSFFGMRSDGWRTTPWLATTNPNYREVMSLLAQGPEPGNSSDGNQTRDDRYRSLTSRSLTQDYQAYTESNKLVALFKDLKNTDSPAARSELMLGTKDLGIDPMRELGMLAKIAQRENVAIKELAIRDRSSGKDLVFNAFGLIGDPREDVNQGLQMAH